jgi:maltose/moltooligosaccharide transporter
MATRGILQKPKMSFWQIWNMSFGFLGIQFGFALQTGFASRILQTFGADTGNLSWFWLAAPLTGMIIQPIIGHYSDGTWNRFGRRKPYFLTGAILSGFALLILPNSSLLVAIIPPIVVGAGIFMMMDASFNVAMEPFRALVADNLPESQYSTGFSTQTFLIGIGAVAGSLLPYIFAEYFHISKTAAPGHVPANLLYSFYIGAAVLIGSILWTVIRTKEYSPEEHAKFHEEELVVVSSKKTGFGQIITDMANMPKTMKQLGLVQFFSWFALFTMWVFTTPALAEHIYHVKAGDTSSVAYNNAGNWVGVLFGIYNGISAIYALLLPKIAKATSRKIAHAFSLTMGGLGLISIWFITDPNWLILSMIGIGLAWGSILSMPYAILSSSIPAKKMGVYMGIFNFFITFPQIVSSLIGSIIVKHLFNAHSVYAIIMAGVFMLLAAISVLYVKDGKNTPAINIPVIETA